MTIGVGFKCQDGIVLATDTQYTTKGSIKSSGPKIFTIVDSQDVAVVIAGAGSVVYMKRASEKIEAAAKGLVSPTLEEARSVAESALMKFYADYVYPMPEWKQREIQIQHILGIWTKHGFGIFENEDGAIAPAAKDYCSIGWGQYVSDAIDLAFNPVMLMVEKAKLASRPPRTMWNTAEGRLGYTRLFQKLNLLPYHVRKVYSWEVRDCEQYTKSIMDFAKQAIGYIEFDADTQFDDQVLESIFEQVRESVKTLRAKRNQRKALEEERQRSETERLRPQIEKQKASDSSGATVPTQSP